MLPVTFNRPVENRVVGTAINYTKMKIAEDDAGPRHYTVAEIAHRFGAHPGTCRRWIREGRIKPLRLGRLVRISAAEVERFEREGAL